MKPTTQNSTRSTMRTKFSRALVWPIAVAAALAACTQDLNITNPNAPDTANFWRTEADAIAGINATYSGLEQRGTYQRWLVHAGFEHHQSECTRHRKLLAHRGRCDCCNQRDVQRAGATRNVSALARLRRI